MRLHPLPLRTAPVKLGFVNMCRTSTSRFPILCGLLILVLAGPRTPAQPTPGAVAAFHQYTVVVESRLSQQHKAPGAFLSADPQEEVRLHRGELIVEQLSPASQPAGALLHHWRGTAFAPGASAEQFERLLRDFGAYPHVFGPQVIEARAQPLGSNDLQAVMRLRQKHVMTVVMDASYDVTFGQLDPHNGYSASRSTHIYEINAAGTDHERVLTPAEEHGFLWRLNTYWTYQQRDHGLYIQVETVSLSRSIPTGLGWVVRPYVTSVPRESLEFTLRSAMNALHK